MSFDDELERFEEITKNFDLSARGKRDARKAARMSKPPAPKRPVQNPFSRVVQWAERRAVSQYRPWNR